jgi:hypothetical protein
MKKLPCSVAGLIALLFIGVGRLTAQTAQTPQSSASPALDLGTLMHFSFDIAKQKEDGASALTFQDIIGWNGGITFLLYEPETWTYQKEAKGFNSFDYNPDNQPAPHWRPGLYADLQYIGKGGKFDGTVGHVNYVELTILGEIDAALGDGAAFFRLGPYLGYGVGGKVGKGSQAQPSFGGDDGYRRFDAGPSIALGYRFSFGGVVYLCYEYGLVNKAPKLNGGYPSDYTDKNRSFGINLAYPIGKIIGAFKRN